MYYEEIINVNCSAKIRMKVQKNERGEIVDVIDIVDIHETDDEEEY